MQLPLQIGAGSFEHRAMTLIAAAIELLNHVLQRKPEALFFPDPGCGFPRQTRLFGCTSRGRFVLLRFDGLAFPTPGHKVSIAFRESSLATGVPGT